MLSTELFVIILKDLHHSNPEFLPKLRLVSKEFDSIIVPMVYTHITLTPKLIRSLGPKPKSTAHRAAGSQAKQDICRFTRHIAIKESVNWNVLAELLQGMENLVSFTWLYRSPTFRYRAFKPVVEVLRKQWPDAGMHLEGERDGALRAYALWQFYHVRGAGLSEVVDAICRGESSVGRGVREAS